MLLETLPYGRLLDFGLAGIVLLGLAEKFVPVLPSYVLLVLIGLLTVADATELPGAVIASGLGSVVGAIGWYGLGSLFGRRRCERLVDRFGRFVFLKRDLYDRMTAAYERRRFWVTVVGQTVPTVRIYLAIPAGVLGLPFLSFVTATALGTLAWNGPLIVIGFLLRDVGWSPAATGGGVAVALIASEVLVIWAITRIRRRRSRRSGVTGASGRVASGPRTAAPNESDLARFASSSAPSANALDGEPI